MGYTMGKKIPRDRYKRPLLPHPHTGEEQPWTRPTTLAATLAETFNLQRWGERMAVKGIGLRRDLYALAAAVDVNDKDSLDEIAAKAKDAAAADAGANLGTALHTFTANLDRGEPIDPPAPWDRDIRAYGKLLYEQGLSVIPQLIERMTCILDVNCAGTFDRVFSYPQVDLGQDLGEHLVIGDVKTGKRIDYGWLEICIQLATYAHADFLWDAHEQRWDPMPPLDQKFAYVMHLPVGTGTATLWRVNIEKGWRAALIAYQVRELQKTKDLAFQVGSVLADAEPDPVSEDGGESGSPSLRQSIAACASMEELEMLWRREKEAGLWTPQHTALARLRKQQFASQQNSV